MKQMRKRRILIVDDSKMNREILTGIKAIEIMEE